jgi:hypothetical protein
MFVCLFSDPGKEGAVSEAVHSLAKDVRITCESLSIPASLFSAAALCSTLCPFGLLLLRGCICSTLADSISGTQKFEIPSSQVWSFGSSAQK